MSAMLAGKTALVTGSTSGIGLGMARALAAQGANLMLNGFGEPPQIETLRQEIEKTYGIKARYHGADMSKPAEIEDLMKTTETAFGSATVALPSRTGGLPVFPSVPDDIRRQAATMFARHNELKAQRRRSR